MQVIGARPHEMHDQIKVLQLFGPHFLHHQLPADHSQPFIYHEKLWLLAITNNLDNQFGSPQRRKLECSSCPCGQIYSGVLKVREIG